MTFFLSYVKLFFLLQALPNPRSVSSNLIDPAATKPKPLTSVESLLHGTSLTNSHNQQSNESPITQVRSSVEKQMNQFQQERSVGFPHTQTSRVHI